MTRLVLLSVLFVSSPTFAQTLSTVWDATVVNASAVAASPDGSVVATGTGSFVFQSTPTGLQFRDAATGAVTGGFSGGIRTPSTLVFDPAGSSIFAAGQTSTCGGGSGNCTSYADIRRVTLDGQPLSTVRTTPSFTSVAGSGPYLTFQRYTGYNSSAFSIYEVGPDSLTLVYVAPERNTLSATFSPDGSRLVTTRDSSGRTVVDIRPVGTWTRSRTIVVPQIDYDRPVSVALSPDNSLLAVDVVPTAGDDPGRIYLIRVSDGAVIANTIHAADSPYEVRYGAPLVFTSDGAYIVGVEAGYIGEMQTEWASVFRATDAVRVASMRVGQAHGVNTYGPVDLVPVPGGTPGVDRFAVVAYNYVGVVEVRMSPPPVAAEDTPAGGGLSVVVAPNPAPDGTTVRLSVPETQAVRVDLFDTLGRHVAVLFDGEVPAGTERLVPVAAGAYPAGVYLVRVTGETARTSRRVVLGGR